VNSAPAGSGDSTRVDIALAEFNAMRAEIAARIAEQGRIVALNVTAIAAVGGAFLSNRVDPAVLLILPLLSVSLGLLWLDQATTMRGIGRHINDGIRPILVDATGDSRVLGAETRAAMARSGVVSRIVRSALPSLVLFLATPSAALAFTTSVTGQFVLVWWVEAAYIGVFLAQWVSWFRGHSWRVGAEKRSVAANAPRSGEASSPSR
jgi:hypothetical protein